MIKNYRFSILLLLAILVSTLFWIYFRYPSLNTKADSIGVLSIANILNFNSFLTNFSSNIYIRSIITAVNWLDTNLRGMTFGVIIAAIFMCIKKEILVKSQNTILSAMGLITTGASMGLCVNCAAPVGIAFSRDKNKKYALEPLLLMTSSPILNFVYINTLFAIFPYKLAFFRVLHIFLIFGVIFFLNRKQIKLKTGLKIQIISRDERFFNSLKTISTQLLKELWKVVKLVLPIMVISAICSGFIIEFNILEDFFPKDFSPISFVVIILLSTLLPVPMLMDLFIANILLELGVNTTYVVTMLFCLGPISMYSLMVLKKVLNLKQVLKYVLFFMLFTFSFIMLISNFNLQEESKGQINFSSLTRKIDDQTKISIFKSFKKELSKKTVYKNYEIQSFPMATKKEPIGKMEYHEGSVFGLNFYNSFTPLDYNSYASHRPTISSEDFNNDGWQDILVSKDDKLYLYQNNTNGFDEFIFTIPLRLKNILSSTFIDIDSDGDQDIFIAAGGEGKYILLNKEGTYNINNLRELYSSKSYTRALAFYDFDNNGLIDIIEGNSFLIPYSPIGYKGSQNYVYLQTSPFQFKKRKLGIELGESLSIFVNKSPDQSPLIITGNDFAVPDEVFIYDNDFKKITLPKSSLMTMSIDSASLSDNNFFDFYSTGITGDMSAGEIVKKTPPHYCHKLKKELNNCKQDIAIAQKAHNESHFTRPLNCRELSGLKLNECSISNLIRTIFYGANTTEDCKLIPDFYKREKDLCRGISTVSTSKINSYTNKQSLLKKSPLQVPNKNIFLSNSNGRYVDQTDKYKVAFAGWSWNAQFADIDNDTYEDIFIANGSPIQKKIDKNKFYRNNENKFFEDYSEKYGLDSRLNSNNYVYTDIDNDGRVDIVLLSLAHPLIVFKNRINQNNSISLSLKSKGNKSLIGTTIKIITNSFERTKQIKKSGGFKSFQPLRLTFGLGKETVVKRLVIYWPDNTKEELTLNLKSNNHYILTRQ